MGLISDLNRLRFVETSSGSGDFCKIPKLRPDGKLDESFIPDGFTGPTGPAGEGATGPRGETGPSGAAEGGVTIWDDAIASDGSAGSGNTTVNQTYTAGNRYIVIESGTTITETSGFTISDTVHIWIKAGATWDLANVTVTVTTASVYVYGEGTITWAKTVSNTQAFDTSSMTGEWYIQNTTLDNQSTVGLTETWLNSDHVVFNIDNVTLDVNNLDRGGIQTLDQTVIDNLKIIGSGTSATRPLDNSGPSFTDDGSVINGLVVEGSFSTSIIVSFQPYQVTNVSLKPVTSASSFQFGQVTNLVSDGPEIVRIEATSTFGNTLTGHGTNITATNLVLANSQTSPSSPRVKIENFDVDALTIDFPGRTQLSNGRVDNSVSVASDAPDNCFTNIYFEGGMTIDSDDNNIVSCAFGERGAGGATTLTFGATADDNIANVIRTEAAGGVVDSGTGNVVTNVKTSY